MSLGRRRISGARHRGAQNAIASGVTFAIAGRQLEYERGEFVRRRVSLKRSRWARRR